MRRCVSGMGVWGLLLGVVLRSRESDTDAADGGPIWRVLDSVRSNHKSVQIFLFCSREPPLESLFIDRLTKDK